MSSFLAGSLHPCAGHFIAEHYFFSGIESGGTESIQELKQAKSGEKPKPKPTTALSSLTPPETYSYYGPLNFFTYNVGLHNEHHDFPAIPWSRLPTLHKIAKEFYEPLPHHRSWVWVIWMFILDKNVGLWCRVKRAEGGRIVGGNKNKSEQESGWKESEIQNWVVFPPQLSFSLLANWCIIPHILYFVISFWQFRTDGRPFAYFQWFIFYSLVLLHWLFHCVPSSCILNP